MVRRMWVATVVMVLVVGGYAAMLAAQLPRDGWVATRYGVWSDWVDEYAASKNPAWVRKHHKPVWRLMRVETATGKIAGRMRTLREYPLQMKMAPDGRHLVIASDPTTLRWVEAKSGRVKRTITARELRTSHNSDCIVGFESRQEGTWVYFAEASRADERSRLVRWNPRTGEQVVVIDEPATSVAPPANAPPTVFARKYALLHWPEGVATVSAPDFMSADRGGGAYPLTIRAPEGTGGAILRTIPIKDDFVMMSPLVATHDGSSVFLTAMSRGIIGVDARTGEELGRLTAGLLDNIGDVFAISAEGTHLLVPVFRESIMVRDMAQRRWVARLKYPEPFIAPWVSSSRDGRWVAAVPFKAMGGRAGPYVRELFLYDVGVLKGTAP